MKKMFLQISETSRNNHVNIAGMTLGRDRAGGQAKTLLKIDSEISEGVMQQDNTFHPAAR